MFGFVYVYTVPENVAIEVSENAILNIFYENVCL